MKQIRFYALKEDLLPVLERIEARCSVSYVRAGQHSAGAPDSFERGAEIPQLANPETVVFTPAGLRNSGMILPGSFGTASEAPGSQRLMRACHQEITNAFVKVKAYYVGTGALALARQGARLALSVQSPRDFDLAVC